MDFSQSPEQAALRQQLATFAQAELNHGISERDRHGIFDRDLWQKCADAGVIGLHVDPAYGGQGHDILTTVMALEGLGYGCRDNGLTFALTAMMFSTVAALIESGNEAQKQTYLTAMCRGEKIGAYALTEPDSGSDAFSLQTTATKVEGGYLLNGEKLLITFAPIADFAIIFATVNPDHHKWGITAFIVDANTPGFDRGPVDEKMGLRTVPIGRFTMTDCFVPDENLLGEEGAGAFIFSSSQEWERALILSCQLGAMEYQLEKAIRYVNERQQFGRPIAKFQAVSNRIVEMKLRLDTAKLLAYHAAWRKTNGIPCALEASLANLYMADSFVQSSLDAILLHGGRGYLTEYEIERDLRDAVGGPVYGGTSDIQKNLVAKQLGL